VLILSPHIVEVKLANVESKMDEKHAEEETFLLPQIKNRHINININYQLSIDLLNLQGCK